MKKLFFTAALAIIGFSAISCNNDDDNKAPSDPKVGTWKAETVSYNFNGQTHTYPYNVEGGPFSGCDVDYLTLKDDKTAKLLEHIKNEDDVCIDTESTGTWTDEVVNVKGGDREIKSFTENQLVLTYPLIYYGQTLPITVEYSKL